MKSPSLKGMNAFFETHKCTRLCERLGLSPLHKTPVPGSVESEAWRTAGTGGDPKIDLAGVKAGSRGSRVRVSKGKFEEGEGGK